LSDKTVLVALRGCLARNPDKRPPIGGSNGLLKQAFLEPALYAAAVAAKAAAASPPSPEATSVAALPLSAVKAIVQRTVAAVAAVQAGPGGAASGRSVEELTALVVEQLCAASSPLANLSPKNSAPAAAAVASAPGPAARRVHPASGSAAAAPGAATAAPPPEPKRVDRAHDERARRPLEKFNLGEALASKLTNLRSGDDAVKAAAKYQKDEQQQPGGGDGLLGSLSRSEMLAKNMLKRRQDMAPDETVNNTGNWDVTESWQN
jgi:hypothetical protein